MNLTFFQNKSSQNYVNKQLDHFQYGSDNVVPCKATDGCTISDPIFLLGSAMFDLSVEKFPFIDNYNENQTLIDTWFKRNFGDFYL